MAGKTLSVLFWFVAAFLIAYASAVGGWALVVPAAVVGASFVLVADLYRHREILSIDADLARTLAHVLSAVAVAATCMYWLARMVLARGS